MKRSGGGEVSFRTLGASALSLSRAARADNPSSTRPAETTTSIPHRHPIPAMGLEEIRDQLEATTPRSPRLLAQGSSSTGRTIDEVGQQHRRQRTDTLISNSFQGTFSFNLGLANHVEVGLDLPIILMDGAAAEANLASPETGVPGGTELQLRSVPARRSRVGHAASSARHADEHGAHVAQRAERGVSRAAQQVAHHARREGVRPRARPAGGPAVVGNGLHRQRRPPLDCSGPS